MATEAKSAQVPARTGPSLQKLSVPAQSWFPQAALIVALTVWVYWPALRGGLIWDDEWYVTLNPQLQTMAGLWKFWFQPGSWVEYYPVHETVLWLQYHLFGSETLGYHLTNLALHLANAFLVWHLLRKLGLRLAWLGGLIFAIHPVQVDSVAYICELKNTLSLAFALLAMSAWIDYDATRSDRDYRNALAFYVIAMLCKITMAPFAAVILLYAWWKRGRIARRDLKAAAPFLLIAIALAAITIWAGHAYENSSRNIIAQSQLGGLFSRIDAVGLISALYFARCFLPVEVLLVYPQWPLQPLDPIQYLPWLAFAVVLVVLWWKRSSWGRHAVLGLGFFFILLAPFLGFLSVSYMNFIWAMDHMLYLPIIGLIGLVVAAVEGIGAQIPAAARGPGIGVLAVVVGLMAWVSHGFAGYFVSGEAYWSHILARNPDVWLARTNLSSRDMELEHFADALVQEDAAIALRPQSADDYYNRGLTLEKLGRGPEAQVAYRQSLEINPLNPKIYLNLGEMSRHAGDTAKAEEIFRAGLKLVPDNSALAIDLAGMLTESKRLPEAIDLYRHVAALNPEQAPVQYNLGNALLQAGNLPEAVEHLSAAVELDPTIAKAHENLGSALAQLGHVPEAMEQFEIALKLNPGLVAARINLAVALTQSGDVPGAVEQFKQVLQVDPDNARARDSLAKLQQYELQQGGPGSR